jgi:glycosidase
MNKELCDKQIYHLYPLGALRNGEGILSLKEWGNYLKELSVTTLLLGPLFQSNNHGYDVTDYYNVDKRLGSNSDLTEVVRSLREQGVEVYLDAVFHHVGRDFFAFQDVLSRREQSPYYYWFFINKNGNSPLNDGFDYQSWEGHYDLVKLNLYNPQVKEFLFNAVKYWIEEFGISGLRLDVAHQLEPGFIAELRDFCEKINSNFLLIGEAIHGDYRQWVNDTSMHSVTNYEIYKGLYSSHNDKNYFEIAYSLERQYNKSHGIYRNLSLYNFADNHDTSRISSAITNLDHLYPLHILLYTIPGFPSLYYGSELGMQGKKEKGSDWNLRPSLNISYCEGHGEQQSIFKHIKKLAQIRKNHRSIQEGDFKQLFVNSEQYGFIRTLGNEKVVILVNMSKEKVVLKSNTFCPQGNYIDVLNNNESVSSNEQIIIYPNWGRVLVSV